MRLHLTGLWLALLVAVQITPVSAESVPFNCMILPGEEVASILMTNSLASDASCIVTCKFATTKYDNNPDHLRQADPGRQGSGNVPADFGRGQNSKTDAGPRGVHKMNRGVS
jgi:hypothetical protein